MRKMTKLLAICCICSFILGIILSWCFIKPQPRKYGWANSDGELLVPYQFTYDPNAHAIVMHYLIGRVVEVHCENQEVAKIFISTIDF